MSVVIGNAIKCTTLIGGGTKGAVVIGSDIKYRDVPIYQSRLESGADLNNYQLLYGYLVKMLIRYQSLFLKVF